MSAKQLTGIMVAFGLTASAIFGMFAKPQEADIKAYKEGLRTTIEEVAVIDINWQDRIEILEYFKKSIENISQLRRAVLLDVTDTPGPGFRVKWKEDLLAQHAELVSKESKISEMEIELDKMEDMPQFSELPSIATTLMAGLADFSKPLKEDFLSNLKQFKLKYSEVLKKFEKDT